MILRMECVIGCFVFGVGIVGCVLAAFDKVVTFNAVEEAGVG